MISRLLQVALTMAGGLAISGVEAMHIGRRTSAAPAEIARNFAGWWGVPKGILPAYGRALSYHPGTRQRQRRRDRRRGCR